MADNDRWRLPDGVEEVLPENAWRMERLRQEVLSLYARWGYDLVIPPLIEYLDSLLVGAGHDLELDTFRLTDQLSGRSMGVRADMTPQVARIDAHRINRDGPVRLCYLGAVLHTRPGPFGGGRSPLQLGAELYGHGGLEADLEVIELLLATLDTAGVDAPLCIDLGHVGIMRALAAASCLDADTEQTMLEVLDRKSAPDLEALLARLSLSEEQVRMWRALGELHGGRTVLDQAHEVLRAAGEPVSEALDYLGRIGDALAQRHPDLRLHFDPSELRGYRYHTGLVFAVYVDDEGEEIARGGRYDGIGGAFGRARPATGFSTDLRRLIVAGHEDDTAQPGAIAAPPDDDADLRMLVRDLRASGERVIMLLPNQDAEAAELGCDRQLVRQNGTWKLEEI